MEMMGDFIQDDEKNLIHVLDLYATHSNTKKQNKLRIIQGLFGMFKQISDLKKACALNKSIAANNPARFVQAQFESELTQRYNAFRKSWGKQLTIHCKSYIKACSLPVVYREDFNILVNDKNIKIEAKDKEFNLSDNDAQVQL